MMIPQVQGGVSPEPIIPIKPDSQEVHFQFPSGTQAANLIATTTLLIPKADVTQMLFRGKEMSQHQVVKILISKFEPALAQMAVLSYRAQAQESAEPTQTQIPKEVGTQRDEVAETPTLGKNLVKLEVSQGESAQPGGEKQKIIKEETQRNEGNQNSNTSTKESSQAIAPVTPARSKQEENIQPQKQVATDQTGQTSRGNEASSIKKESKEGENPSVKPEPEKSERRPTEMKPILAKHQEAQEPVQKKNEEQKELSTSRENPMDEQITDKVAPPQPIQKRSVNETVKPQEELKEATETKITGHKHHPKELPQPSIGVMGHHVRIRSEDIVPAIYYRMHPVETDVAGLMPPWLALLVPDLMELETSRDQKSGKQKETKSEQPHKLSDLLFILLAAHFTGAKSLTEIFQWMNIQEKWLSVVLGLQHGLPPRQLFFWFLAALENRKFDQMVGKWLAEVRGRVKGTNVLHDVQLWKTPLGFVVGQKQQDNEEASFASMIATIEGFHWTRGTVMAKLYGNEAETMNCLQKKQSHFIMETQRKFDVPSTHAKYESYLEGQERIIVQQWETDHFTRLKLYWEVYDNRGVTSSEHYYVSNISDPVEEFFSLFRLQRPYEAKNSWLLNFGLNFSNVDEALQLALHSLKKFEKYALHILVEAGDRSGVEQRQKRAAVDHDYLLSLFH